nr:MAG TPA: hypothetical protein [Caudoviricetes sp.]
MYFHEVTSNFLSPVRGYAERECMSLRFAHTVSWLPGKAST